MKHIQVALIGGRMCRQYLLISPSPSTTLAINDSVISMNSLLNFLYYRKLRDLCELGSIKKLLIRGQLWG